MTSVIKNSFEVPSGLQMANQPVCEKIPNLVSYIYYPAPNEFPCLGHAELEIEGKSWTILGEKRSIPLSKMIASSQEGRGSPFFRFEISVSPDKLNDLKNNLEKVNAFTCSDGVCQALSKYGDYSIPFPLMISPLASALYLTGARMLGSRRIQKIEFYGDQKSSLGNIFRCSPGIAIEAAYLIAIAYSLSNLR